jgi:chitinase
MIDLFFKHLSKKKSSLPNPKPNSQRKVVSFCDYVDALWDVPALVWPGQDTSGGGGTPWNPIMHIAAQFRQRRSRGPSLSPSSPPSTRFPRRIPGEAENPWKTDAWNREISKYEEARKIHQKMSSTMDSRIYQSHSTISTTMKTQTVQIGKVLDALDSTLLDGRPALTRRFVYATSSEAGDTVQLTSYRSPRDRERLLRTTKILEAGRATLVVSPLFDDIAIGDFDESLVGGV